MSAPASTSARQTARMCVLAACPPELYSGACQYASVQCARWRARSSFSHSSWAASAAPCRSLLSEAVVAAPVRPGLGAEIVEIAARVAGRVFVVARRRMGARLEAAPRRLVAVLEFGCHALRVSVVAEAEDDGAGILRQTGLDQPGGPRGARKLRPAVAAVGDVAGGVDGDARCPTWRGTGRRCRSRWRRRAG